MTDFFARLEAACAAKDSLLCVGLDPRLASRPKSIRHLSPDDAPHHALTQAIVSENRMLIEQTLPFAAAYKPNIAFYEAWGAYGIVALEETIRLIPHDVPIILDSKRNDIGTTAAAYAQSAFEHFDVDAVTLSPYLGKDAITPFLDYKNRGVFVLCRTSNPSARAVQDLVVNDGKLPLYLQIAAEAHKWSAQIGLVVAGNDPEALTAVRAAHPGTWFLAPGIGAQGGNAADAIAAGSRTDGFGMLVVVSRGVSEAADPGTAARDFRDQLNRARQQRTRSRTGPASSTEAKHVSRSGPTAAYPETTHEAAPSAELRSATVSGNGAGSSSPVLPVDAMSGPAAKIAPAFARPESEALVADSVINATEGPREHRKRMVLHGLVRTGCFRVGEFVLKSGIKSPFYVDLRRIVSDPVFLKLIAQAYASISRDLDFSRIAGIPMAGLPIATAVSIETGVPLIYPRLSVKDHGTGNRIEGEFRRGDRVLLLDDLITSGKSKIEAVEVLRSEGIEVSDLVVLLERSNRARTEIEAAGIHVHAYAHVTELFATCRQMAVIDEQTEKLMREFIEQEI